MATDETAINDFSLVVENRELVWIPLRDGRQLAARICLPSDSSALPVPAILEYIPYRRRDGTRGRDEPSNYWMAAQGYATVRVDISGSGDSDGLIEDEYVQREQDDALDIIEWLAAQQWCTGSVGMIGISWGGFNGLQVAARRPAALKAVISLCSTVDRYHDDVHFTGGCLLSDNLDWGSIFFTLGGLAPDPAMVGEDRWKDIWLQRLEALPLYPQLWLEHQRRDEFWAHGSVIEDYAAIEVPVLAVSGWADGYSNTVFRLLENLSAPCKGIVGPWGHKYPHQGMPGPAMGFLQECTRWWDKWLKGEDTGVESDPALRFYQQSAHKPEPSPAFRDGRWLGLPDWSAAGAKTMQLNFSAQKLVATDADKPLSPTTTQQILSPLTTGIAAGEWCAYAMGKIAPEMPFDQREDDAGSLTFTGEPLTEELNLLGRVRVNLRIAADKPQGIVAVRLCDVRPDGLVTRVSYGVLNLSHRSSHSNPTPLEPGTFYDVAVELNEAGQQFPLGHRLRISISSSYWPMIWPSAESSTLTLDVSGCNVSLPLLDEHATVPVSFKAVSIATPLKTTVMAEGAETREIRRDIESRTTTYVINRDDGITRIDDIGTEVAVTKEKRMSITGDDPLSSVASVQTQFSFHRDDWQATTETHTHLCCDKDYFYLTASINASSNGSPVFERKFDYSIKRDNV